VAEADPELVAGDVMGRGRSGADGTRTRGLYAASVPLYQLSYSPIEVVIGCKVNAGPLPVPGGLEPQIDGSPIREQRFRKKVATVELTAIDRDEVDLARFISLDDLAARRPP
jgi:hypothetical protein